MARRSQRLERGKAKSNCAELCNVVSDGPCPRQQTPLKRSDRQLTALIAIGFGRRRRLLSCRRGKETKRANAGGTLTRCGPTENRCICCAPSVPFFRPFSRTLKSPTLNSFFESAKFLVADRSFPPQQQVAAVRQTPDAAFLFKRRRRRKSIGEEFNPSSG